MAIEKASVQPYFSVKLNIPWRHADTIRALVPEGKPVSGTLINLLVDLASERGIAPEVDPSPDRLARAEAAVVSLREEVIRLSDRLDATVSTLRAKS